jgi:hypothetical protein
MENYIVLCTDLIIAGLPLESDSAEEGQVPDFAVPEMSRIIRNHTN